jgi:hypothetical protein
MRLERIGREVWAVEEDGRRYVLARIPEDVDPETWEREHARG